MRRRFLGRIWGKGQELERGRGLGKGLGRGLRRGLRDGSGRRRYLGTCDLFDKDGKSIKK